jgi:uncharacterized protein (DUF2342 family)
LTANLTANGAANQRMPGESGNQAGAEYQVGESFARAVHDRYGMAVLNRAWESPETLPRAEELRDFDRWYRRVGAEGAAVAVR